MSWKDILKITEEQRIEDAKNYASPYDFPGQEEKNIEKLLDYIVDDITDEMLLQQNLWDRSVSAKPKSIFPYKSTMSIGNYPYLNLLMRIQDEDIEEEMKKLLQKPKYKNWHNRDFPHDFSNLIIEVTTDNYPNLETSPILNWGDIRFNISIDKDNIEYKKGGD